MTNQPVPYTLTPRAEEELALADEAEADWGDEWDDAGSGAYHARVEAGREPVGRAMTATADRDESVAASRDLDWNDMSREEQNDAWHRQSDRFAAMENARADLARCQALEPAEAEREARRQSNAEAWEGRGVMASHPEPDLEAGQ